MALITENGTTSGGVPNAESYCDVTFADAYWAGRNATNAATWAALTTPKKEAALREACQYLDNGFEWRGDRLSSTQYLNWPRAISGINTRSTHLVDTNLSLPGINAIPLALKQAQCELALEAAGGKLAPTYDPSQTVEAVQVGPINVKYGTRGGTVSAPNKRFPLITLLLKDIASGSNTGGLTTITAQRG